MIDGKEIVLTYLIKSGYDGLYCDACHCSVDDLMPCKSLGSLNCQPYCIEREESDGERSIQQRALVGETT